MVFEFKKNKTIFRLIFLIFFVFCALFSHNNVFAINNTEESIRISERESNLILNSLIGKITEERINGFASYHSNPKEGAILALLEKTIRVNSFNYLINQAPKEIITDFIKSAARIAPAVLDPSLSNIVRMGTEEAGKYAIEWISRNKLKIAGGKLSISYLDYKKETKNENLTYILTYNPKNDKIEIKIYSPRKITPPESRGSFSGYSVKGGGFWDKEAWLKEGNSYLSPFIVEINGNIKPNQYGGYSWQGRPSIIIDFSSPVPLFEFKEKTSFWDKIKSGFSQIANTGSSALNYFLNIFSKESTTISLDKENDYFLDNQELKETKPNQDEKDKESEKININTANEKDLTQIIHIGPARAKEIIKMRPFLSLDDLIKVHGIGEKIISDIKDQGLAYVDDFLKELKPNDKNDNDKNEVNEIEDKKEVQSEDEIKIKSEIEEKKDEKEVEKEDKKEKIKKVEINSATLEELQAITRIGPVYAQRIINKRPFCSIDELIKISGIGESTLNQIKNQGIAYVNPPDSCFKDTEKEIYHDDKDNGNDGGDDPSTGSGQDPSTGSGQDPSTGSGQDGDEKEETEIECVDINYSSKEKLQELIGVGPAIAQNIINERPFYSIDDLLNVSRIGPTILSNIKEQGLVCELLPESLNGNNDDSGQDNGNDTNFDQDNDFEIQISGAETVWNANLSLSCSEITKTSEVKILNNAFVFSADSKMDFENLKSYNEKSTIYQNQAEIQISGAETVWDANLSLSCSEISKTSEVKILNNAFVFSADSKMDFLIINNLNLIYEEENFAFIGNNAYSGINYRFLL